MPIPLYLLSIPTLWGDPNTDAALRISRVQREMDQIAAQIDQGIEQNRASSGYELVDLSTAIEQIRLARIRLEPDDRIDVDIRVVDTTPQQAGAFLSFGGTNLDLAFASEALGLAIEGKKGRQELTFVSGTTLPDIASSIETFRTVTGVGARVSGTGVLLLSDDVGETSFVSVQKTTSAQVVDGAGVFVLASIDPPKASSSGGISFGFSKWPSPFVDRGDEFSAVVEFNPPTNQFNQRVDGSIIQIFGGFRFFDAQMRLASGPLGPGETANGSNAGLLRAFTILYAEPSKPIRVLTAP